MFWIDSVVLSTNYDMKKCSNATCDTLITSDTAYRRDSKRLHSMCKKCFNAYCVERWINRKLEVIESKGGKCLDCKNIYPHFVYDFHHINDLTKELDWSKMRLVSKSRLNKELENCVLLCANCHRLRHYS